jgi:hypothetical protein
MPEPTQLAQNRADLIKRLFAVIVSVGFASQLTQMKWIVDARWPAVNELPHILVLFLGLFLIIQSWEGYLTALEQHPLKRGSRFYLDVIIVFTYLVLLTTSGNLDIFLFIICVIFLEYAIWDFLTCADIDLERGCGAPSLFGYMRRVMTSTYESRSRERQNLSTLIALIWFIEIFLLYLELKQKAVYVTGCLLAIFVGLLIYRSDQASPRRAILLAVAPLLCLVLLLYLYFRG